MFDFKRPTSKPVAKTEKRTLGKTWKKKDSDGEGMVSESSVSSAGPRLNGMDMNLDTSLLLEGMDSDLHDKQLFRVYRDMYWHDPVCGACADTFSVMPFSDFNIGGADDKILDAYRENIEVLGMRTAMPKISIDHQVTGAYCGSMLYNSEQKRIFDMMPHKYENLAVHSLPLYSQDPIMYLKLDDQMKATLRLDSKRIDMIKEQMGSDFFNKLLEKEVELDPIGTLYAPRKTFTFGEGVSYFKRVLPIWMIEKNLYRGTLIESGRRQRGILHLMLGEEGWEPTQDDFDAATDLFMDADADPIGAVIATRMGLAVQELRQGGDFWKVTDIWDQTSAIKMRGLGIGEAFLSGDASYATMEGSLTVLVESMRAYRDMLTRKTFYEKIFPLTSLMHGNVVTNRGKIVKRNGLMNGNTQDVLTRMKDGSKLFIPTVHWSKQLKPEQDTAYLDLLDRLTTAGVPVPLRAMAAAGGFNLDDLLLNQSEDLAIQKRMLQYNKELAGLKARFGPPAADGEGGGMGSFSSGSAVLGDRLQPMFNRDFGEAAELHNKTVTGKKTHIFRQAEANKRINEKIVKAVTSLSKSNSTQLTRRTHTPHTAAKITKQVAKTLGL